MSQFRTKIQYVLLAMTGLWLSGCYACMDEIMQAEMTFKNQCRSQWAWCKAHDCYEDVDHKFHFARGFKQGYLAAAQGGADVCIPTTPPRMYWKSCYQNCKGRDKINAWFEGYAHGILVAAQDGAANYNSMPTMGMQQYGAHQHASHEAYLEEDVRKRERTPPAPEPERNLPPAPPAYDEPSTGHSLNRNENENEEDLKVPMPEQNDPFEDRSGPMFEKPDAPVLPLPEVRFESRDQNIESQEWYSEELRNVQYRPSSAGNGNYWQETATQKQIRYETPFDASDPWE